MDREGKTCFFRQYYRLSGGVPVRILTLKREKDSKFWVPGVGKETADNIQSVGGGVSHATNAIIGGAALAPGPAAEIPLSPLIFTLDFLDAIAVLAPELDEPLIDFVELDRGTRGLAQARPRGDIYVIHRRFSIEGFESAPPKISVFDPARMEVTRVMELSGMADVTYTEKPFTVAPDESVFYVANRGEVVEDGQFRAEPSVEIYDVATGAMAGNIPMPPGPGSDAGQVDLIAVSPDGAMVWAGRESGRRIAVIDTRTRTVSATFEFNGGMRDLAFHPNGSEVYVLVLGSLRVFNSASLTEVANIPLENARNAVRMTVSPDGADVFVRDDLEGLVWHVDTAARAVIETSVENPGYLNMMVFTR